MGNAELVAKYIKVSKVASGIDYAYKVADIEPGWEKLDSAALARLAEAVGELVDTEAGQEIQFLEQIGLALWEELDNRYEELDNRF